MTDHVVPRPSEIVAALDQYVIGQDAAKRTLAVAVYAHYKKVRKAQRDGIAIAKSNVLLIGPPGTGKTLTCATLARILDVPFVTAEATSLAQTRYVSDEIETILLRLVDRAGGDIAAAQSGIVFIDEIDKLKAGKGESRGSSGESVQHALLKIMEGSKARLSIDRHIDTTDILFICGGAFVGIEEIMAQTHGFGFIATSDSDDRRILERLNSRIKPTDLAEYGLIPEFTGRLPIVARFEALTRDMLVRVLVEPRDSIYRQFRDIFANEGVELRFERRVFEQIAELALEYKSGARSLRSIVEDLIAPILYRVPDEPGIRKVTVSSLFAAPKFEGPAG